MILFGGPGRSFASETATVELEVRDRGSGMGELRLCNTTRWCPRPTSLSRSGGAQIACAKGMAEDRALIQLRSSTATRILAAFLSTQTAKESAQLRHGWFTYALLEGLAGKAQIGNRVTVKILGSYLSAQIPNLARRYAGDPQYLLVLSVQLESQDFARAVARQETARATFGWP